MFVKSHPTLCKAPIELVPPSCMSLSATNGSSHETVVYITLSLALGDITRRNHALVLPSLGSDQVSLDNDVMSRFGAILDGKNKRLTFSSSAVTIPAAHRSPDARANATSSRTLRSVAAVHDDAEIYALKLRNCIDLRPRHSAISLLLQTSNLLTIWKSLLNREYSLKMRWLSTSVLSSLNELLNLAPSPPG